MTVCHLKSTSPFMRVMSGRVNNVLIPLFGGKYFKKIKDLQNCMVA